MQTHKSLLLTGPLAVQSKKAARQPSPPRGGLGGLSPLSPPPPERELRFYTSPYHQRLVRPRTPTPDDAPRGETHAFTRSVRYNRPPSPGSAARIQGRKRQEQERGDSQPEEGRGGGRLVGGGRAVLRIPSVASHAEPSMSSDNMHPPPPVRPPPLSRSSSSASSTSASLAAAAGAAAVPPPTTRLSAAPGDSLSAEQSPRSSAVAESPRFAQIVAESPRFAQSWRGGSEHEPLPSGPEQHQHGLSSAGREASEPPDTSFEPACRGADPAVELPPPVMVVDDGGARSGGGDAGGGGHVGCGGGGGARSSPSPLRASPNGAGFSLESEELGSPRAPSPLSPKQRFSLLEGTSSVAVGGIAPARVEAPKAAEVFSDVSPPPQPLPHDDDSEQRTRDSGGRRDAFNRWIESSTPADEFSPANVPPGNTGGRREWAVDEVDLLPPTSQPDLNAVARMPPPDVPSLRPTSPGRHGHRPSPRNSNSSPRGGASAPLGGSCSSPRGSSSPRRGAGGSTSPRGSLRSLSPSPRKKGTSSGYSPMLTGPQTSPGGSSPFRYPDELEREPKSMWRRAWEKPKRSYGDEEGGSELNVMNEAARVRFLDEQAAKEKERAVHLRKPDIKREKVPKAHAALNVMSV